MELLYADDLVLLADSMKELIEKVKRWRAGLEEKGLRVNLCKTKIMKCCDVSHQVEKSGKFPCGICGKGVGSNSIKCTSCMAWIHKKCSGINWRLQNVADIFKCTKCRPTSNFTITQTAKVTDVEIGVNEKLECVERF